MENNCPDQLLDGLRYLVKISEVEDTEIFKVCLEFWNTLAGELYRESPNNQYIHSSLAYNHPQVNKHNLTPGFLLAFDFLNKQM